MYSTSPDELIYIHLSVQSSIDQNDFTCNDEIFLNAINEKRLNITMNNVIYETWAYSNYNAIIEVESSRESMRMREKI